MTDENDLSNSDLVASFCADLLAEEANEFLVVELLRGQRGDWKSVSALIAQRSVKASLQRPAGLQDLYVTWLDLPAEDSPDFVLVVFQFCGDEDVRATTAVYNRGRLERAGRLV
jgi:hypothetical protein